MKKIKWTIMTLVVSLSVGGALATKPHFDCRTQQQFYLSGGVYFATGTFGVNYVCNSSPNACTYTTDGFGHYTMCQLGEYQPILGGLNQTQKTESNKK